LDVASSEGIIVNGVSHLAPFFKGVYKLVYSSWQAANMSRIILPGGVVQDREDGWATYFKFLAWTMMQYERVLFIDVDCKLYENPDRMFRDKSCTNSSFQAYEKKR
jgi:hypothetical protein